MTNLASFFLLLNHLTNFEIPKMRSERLMDIINHQWLIPSFNDVCEVDFNLSLILA